MRFSKKLSALLTPEWREQYIAYEELKSILIEAVDTAPPSVGVEARVNQQHYINYGESFFQKCDAELRKINNFYAEKLAEANRKHDALLIELRHCLGLAATTTRKSLVDLNKILTKRRTKLLRFAFSEFYLSLVLLQNYQTLNHTGFRKILKKHDKMLNSAKGSKWFAINVEEAFFFVNHDIINMIHETENIFTNHLEGGDRSRAMKRLRVPPLEELQHPWTTFRLGLYLGAFLVVITAAILKFDQYDMSPNNYITFQYLCRGPSFIFFFIFLISLNVFGWRKAGVNHILIFEIEPRDHLNATQIMQIATALSLIWALSIIGLLYAQPLSTPLYAYPLALLVIMFLYLINPLPIFNYTARIWSLKLMGRVAAAPFFHVGFADFWMGDQLNSLATCLTDYKYIVCFYATNFNYEQAESPNQCMTDDYIVTPILRCLPAWIRFWQCMRRYYDTRRTFPFILNAIKYLTTFPVVCFATLMAYHQKSYQSTFENHYVWGYLIFRIINSIYCYLWDVLRDFGLLTKFSGENIFLRDQTVYPHSFYYFAIIANFLLRFFWILGFYMVEKNLITNYNVQSIDAYLEVFRRFIWNFLRLEMEHLFNIGRFRAVRDIAIIPLDTNDQMVLQRMMDDVDGVENRTSKSTDNGDDDNESIKED